MTDSQAQPFDEAKFVALLTYAADKLSNDRSTGLTKLNKVTYLADFAHYRGYGVPITGAQYMHNHHGPTAREMASVLRKLEESGAVTENEELYLGMPQRKLVVLNPVDTAALSSEELETVDEVVELVRGRTATEVSDLTHRELGWKLTELGEEIPYFTAYLGDGTLEPSPAVRGFADKLRAKLLN